MKQVKLEKCWHWECECGADGYEPTKETAKERAREHLEVEALKKAEGG